MTQHSPGRQRLDPEEACALGACARRVSEHRGCPEPPLPPSLLLLRVPVLFRALAGPPARPSFLACFPSLLPALTRKRRPCPPFQLLLVAASPLPDQSRAGGAAMADTAQNGPMQGGAGGGAVVSGRDSQRRPGGLTGSPGGGRGASGRWRFHASLEGLPAPRGGSPRSARWRDRLGLGRQQMNFPISRNTHRVTLGPSLPLSPTYLTGLLLS